MTLREKLSNACAESDSYTVKTNHIFLGFKQLQMAQNIYSYVIKGLLH